MRGLSGRRLVAGWKHRAQVADAGLDKIQEVPAWAKTGDHPGGNLQPGSDVRRGMRRHRQQAALQVGDAAFEIAAGAGAGHLQRLLGHRQLVAGLGYRGTRPGSR